MNQILGTAVHAALAHYYESRRDFDPELADPDTARIQAIQEETSATISAADLERICVHSASFWEKWLDPFLKDEIIAVEQVLEHPDYTSKADLIVRRDTGIWIADHKTTSRLGEMWNYDFSFTALAHQGQRHFGKDFAGIIRHNIAFTSAGFLMNWLEPFQSNDEHKRIFSAHLDHWDAIRKAWFGKDISEVPAVHRGPKTEHCSGCALFAQCHRLNDEYSASKNRNTSLTRGVPTGI